ncbi:hypothetical protein ACFPOH_07240 [Ureibacillus suwonensis]|uniref:Uncharacterized protein n=1 Tax=Ureibacillus suwonensis TaxID=313007 RepID=A0ABW0R9U7_9BACL
MKIEKDGKVIEATEKAFTVVYQPLGYKLYEKPKTTRKKQAGGENDA